MIAPTGLTFVNPVKSGSPAALAIDLGQPTVPLPLRAYPAMPTLLDHAADAPTRAASVDAALRWTYRFTLRHQSAEQDTIHVRLAFNHGSLSATLLEVPSDDLFGWLAQYNLVRAPL